MAVIVLATQLGSSDNEWLKNVDGSLNVRNRTPGNLRVFEDSVNTSKTIFSNINKSNSFLTGNTSQIRYRAQPVNAVWGNSRCLP
jgi:hypothetical protein